MESARGCNLTLLDMHIAADIVGVSSAAFALTKHGPCREDRCMRVHVCLCSGVGGPPTPAAHVVIPIT